MFTVPSGHHERLKRDDFDRTSFIPVLLTCLLIAWPSATAAPIDFSSDSQPICRFVIEASSTLGFARVDICEAEGTRHGDNWIYQLPEPLELNNEQGQMILQVSDLLLFTTNAPQVSLNFLVVAGQANTHFHIRSQEVSFDPIPSTIGRASAGITVTDLNGDGVQLVGAYAGGTRSYQSIVNPLTTPMPFASLVENLSLGSASSITSSGIFPLPVGSYSPSTDENHMLGMVSSMQAEFTFTLSAFDVAAGTSVFDLMMVPEPATALLLLLLLSRTRATSRQRNPASSRRRTKQDTRP